MNLFSHFTKKMVNVSIWWFSCLSLWLSTFLRFWMLVEQNKQFEYVRLGKMWWPFIATLFFIEKTITHTHNTLNDNNCYLPFTLHNCFQWEYAFSSKNNTNPGYITIWPGLSSLSDHIHNKWFSATGLTIGWHYSDMCQL